MSLLEAPAETPAAPRRKGVAAERGAVYTPPLLAEWTAARLLRAMPAGVQTILDPACGEGALLETIADLSPASLHLVGVDVDRGALKRARQNLPGAQLKLMDTLAAALDGAEELRQELNLVEPVAAILNPPWGIKSIPGRKELRAAGFELAGGQFDSADLFTELTVKLLADGEAAALILPDSLFYPDRAPLRRFLLDNCTLELVARLGEGFFPGVYRGVAVVVLRRGEAAPGHAVECVRLSPAGRRRALGGEATLEEVAAESSHLVPQRRFAAEPGASLSIDQREDDLRHVHAVQRQGGGWARTLASGRGVELSKHGAIVDCPTCGRSRPRPRGSSLVDCACGASLDPAKLAARRIVRPRGEGSRRGWRQLIAGEDVRRYRVEPGREIEFGIEGINYKRGATAGPRLLVRKTGIGLKAALYEGRALTTQTVFHFQASDESPGFLLAYALGVLSSRVMLAVHLKRSGEHEWRSHPYVTQSLLAELPIPEPEPGTQRWKQAEAIAAAAAPGIEPGTEADLELEALVAGLYGLGEEDMTWVGRVLDEVGGEMEGVVSLRLPEGARVTPRLVD
ncbi:MAG TPA: N-6 DNA methylase [Solirubrobacterales bacterium]|nr:N-6 DNA methylase [Solirubrobacterales bacterium]